MRVSLVKKEKGAFTPNVLIYCKWMHLIKDAIVLVGTISFKEGNVKENVSRNFLSPSK